MQHYLIIQSTDLSVKDVMTRLEAFLKEKGVTIFARIDHSQAAADAGLSMQPEEVLIFGNPKVGTALMLDNPAIGIELPLKVLVWQEGKKTQVAYQNLDKLKEIFSLSASVNTLQALKTFMEHLIKTAVQ